MKNFALSLLYLSGWRRMLVLFSVLSLQLSSVYIWTVQFNVTNTTLSLTAEGFFLLEAFYTSVTDP